MKDQISRRKAHLLLLGGPIQKKFQPLPILPFKMKQDVFPLDLMGKSREFLQLQEEKKILGALEGLAQIFRLEHDIHIGKILDGAQGMAAMVIDQQKISAFDGEFSAVDGMHPPTAEGIDQLDKLMGMLRCGLPQQDTVDQIVSLDIKATFIFDDFIQITHSMAL